MKRKKERERVEVQETIETEAHDSIERSIMEKETKAYIRRRLNEMPPNYREVIYAYYIDGKTYQQIAEEQKIEIKTVETKLYRARSWLRKHWKEEEFR